MAEIVETAGYLCSLGARVHGQVNRYARLTENAPRRSTQRTTTRDGDKEVKGQVAGRYEIEARELEYQKASATQGGRLTQLDGQGGIRGLIEDATRDTTLWLQADPSPEEQAHVLAMQGWLGRRGK